MERSTWSDVDRPLPTDSPPSAPEAHDTDPEELDELLARARAVNESLEGMSPLSRNDPLRLARALASEVVELIEEVRASRPPSSRKDGC